MKNLNLFGKTYLFVLGIILAFEALSFLAHLVPELNPVYLIVFTIVFLILSLINLKYGLAAILAELIIASKGYLFYLDLGSFQLSFRLTLFLVVFFAFTVHIIKQRKIIFKQSNLYTPFIFLIIFLALGTISGFVRDNATANIFLDLNGYLYLGLIPVFYEVIKNNKNLNFILEVVTASITASILKTITLLYIFSHNFEFTETIYKWIRSTGVGEIATMPNGFSRIFFQSHIFETLFFVIILTILIFVPKKNIWQNKKLLLLCFASSMIVIISFSRSFWLALLIGIGVLFAILLFKTKVNFKTVSAICIVLIVALVAQYFLILGVAKFPIPTTNLQSDVSLIKDRTSNISSEAGAASRFELIKPLWGKVIENPIFGTGFGTTVTYQTKDPRALESNPDGNYTTYAFEWGYLDIILKIGLLGLIVYLLFILHIAKDCWQNFKHNTNSDYRYLSLGLLIAIITLTCVHMTTPYLNHPLGIGFIMLAASLQYYFSRKNVETIQETSITK